MGIATSHRREKIMYHVFELNSEGHKVYESKVASLPTAMETARESATGPYSFGPGYTVIVESTAYVAGQSVVFGVNLVWFGQRPSCPTTGQPAKQGRTGP